MSADALHTPTTSLLADQRSHWDRGERLPVEHYLKREPDLHENTEVLLDLIYAEVVLRREAGEDPNADEYVARFPQLEEPIRTQFEVDEAIDDAATQLADTDRIGPDYSITPPKTPAGYALMERLGHGGMGVVYKARQLGLDRLVAIKMIRSGELADPMERARFDAEARAVAKLSHPNITQIYEVGETESGPYLALEYVAGKSLADALRDSPYPPRQAAILISILARAVDYAHQAGIIHRDLKPANILLARDERSDGSDSSLDPPSSSLRPKITDFGLAKRIGSDKLTRTGDFLGTPNFTAPEQAAGKSDVGPVADVYSLGAILYQTLTGRPPFSGATPLETLDLVRFSDPVPPSRLRPNVPRDLETIALKCLSKDPGKRYPSAAALADDVDRFLQEKAIQARPVGSIEKAIKWCRRRPAMAGMTATIVLLIVASFITVTTLWQQAAKARDDEALARADERVQRERAQERSAEVLIVNARQSLVTSDIESAKRSLAECPVPYQNSDWAALNRICQAARVLVAPGVLPVNTLGFNRDGTQLSAGATAGRMLIWDVESGNEAVNELSLVRNPLSLAFDHEGRVVVAINSGSINNGKTRDSSGVIIFDPKVKKEVGRVDRPEVAARCEVSPNGTKVVYVTQRSRKAEVFDAVSGKTLFQVEGKVGNMTRAAFSPNSRYLVTAALPKDLTVWDAENGFLVRQIDTSESFFGYNAIAVSNDGQQVAIGAGSGSRPTEIILFHRGQEVRRIPSHYSILTGIAMSADGHWLAGFSGSESVVRVWEVATGREEIVFSGFPTSARCICFSPNSRQLAVGYGDGRIVIWTIQP